MAKFRVTADNLNVRTGPGQNFPVISNLKEGDVIEEVSQVPDWCPFIMSGVQDQIGFVSRQYLEPVDETPAPAEEVPAPAEAPAEQPAPEQPAPTGPTIPAVETAGEGIVETPAGDPPWIVWAKSKLGINQTDNAAEIESWDQYTSLDKSLWHQIVAWCAIFANAALFNGGKQGDKDAWAADFLNWGIPVDEPQIGDILVWDWSLIGQTGHHVNFFLADLGNGYYRCIGGNQHHAVTIANFPVSALAGIRRAA